ncbi:MAG TPA: hypothetical protein VH599_16800 [Ktedonobacterales bacterium]|jgi:plasmid stability protein
MAQQTLTLNIPDDLYQRLQQRAAKARHTIEDEVVDMLAAGAPGDDRIPADLKEMLNSMVVLDDAALWQAARSHLSRKRSDEIEALHFKRQREGLTDAEKERLAWLMRQYERTMLIRAEAAAILKRRGHDVNVLLKKL